MSLKTMQFLTTNKMGNIITRQEMCLYKCSKWSTTPF